MIYKKRNFNNSLLYRYKLNLDNTVFNIIYIGYINNNKDIKIILNLDKTIDNIRFISMYNFYPFYIDRYSNTIGINQLNSIKHFFIRNEIY